MRKFKLFSLLIAFSFILINCTKEGPEGPPGVPGPQGPSGANGATGGTGATGTANVIYSSWFTLTSWADTSFTAGFAGTLASRALKTAPGITQSILDQGVVLSYVSNGGVYMLPVFIAFLGQTLQVNFTSTVGRIIYFISNITTGSASGFSLPNQFRYVIIPGGVAGGRGINSEKIAKINGQNYTETQLKAMSYNEICTLLKIAQ